MISGSIKYDIYLAYMISWPKQFILKLQIKFLFYNEFSEHKLDLYGTRRGLEGTVYQYIYIHYSKFLNGILILNLWFIDLLIY